MSATATTQSSISNVRDGILNHKYCSTILPLLVNNNDKQLSTTITNEGKTYIPTKINIKDMAEKIFNKYIPEMYNHKEYAMFYHNHLNDFACISKKEYLQETNKYKNNSLAKVDGDCQWYIEYTKIKKGKTIKCHITTEVWYYPEGDKDIPTSPLACIFHQYLSAGFFIIKVRFEE